MRVLLRAVIGTMLTAVGALPSVAAAQTATQVVTFSVVSSTYAAIGSASAPLRPAQVSLDRTRTAATVAGTSYAIVTNERNQKITASIDASAPNSASVAVALDAPPGGASKGLTVLGTTATDVVTGISGTDGVALPMSYQWKGNATAASLRHRVVTYTITSGL